MADNLKSLKVIELMQIGFSVSIDATEHEENIDSIVETARMFNSSLILRNMPESLLDQKSLKRLKAHSHKIIIET
ncbi:MAG: hypothetical protein ACERKJ_04475 [Candidatus Dadabacteria bacterium]|jgi:hypothetical protein|nr:MAG: hypothetical protein E4H21_09850 [Thermodesulfobacteriales bacterium]